MGKSGGFRTSDIVDRELTLFSVAIIMKQIYTQNVTLQRKTNKSHTKTYNMSTFLGDYLKSLGVVKEKVRSLANIKKPRMNDLNNKHTAKPSPEEFYRIVYTAIKLSGLDDEEFKNAIEAVFPNRPKNNLLTEFEHLPAEIRFIKRHTLRQNEVEEKIGMSENKISRLTNEKTKDLLAVELICFIEGLELNVLKTFKELYGEIEVG